MGGQSIRYAVLRDRHAWDERAGLVGLRPGPDGALRLARVPGVAAGHAVIVNGSPAVEPSGMAAGACGNLYLADSAGGCVIRLDSACNTRTRLPGAGGAGAVPGQFNRPCGLLVAGDSLYVADSGNRRVQVFRLPGLELRAIWEEPLVEPIALAGAAKGQIWVLDRGSGQARRFNVRGDLLQVVECAPAGGKLASLAVDAEGVLYLTTEQAQQVLRLDATGAPLDPLPANARHVPAPAKPRQLAAHGEYLYVADASSGAIWVFDRSVGAYLGVLADYRGPVAALAVAPNGTLYVKAGPDAVYHTLQADIAYLAEGTLTAGPFDASDRTEWERVHAQIELPKGATAELRLFATDREDKKPTEADWAAPGSRAATLDTLICTVPAIAGLAPAARRFLWLRVTLRSDDCRRNSPRLLQVQAETTGKSYLDYLPAVYRREDVKPGFLKSWLALFRSELGDLEHALDDMAQRFDPVTAPEDQLRWLATWLAFDPPADIEGAQLRELLGHVRELYDQRGTPGGMRAFIELYTGVRPHIFEAYRERHVWQLGYTSALGFDTALAAGLPDGMIVPGYTLAEPAYMGLRGAYYGNLDFKELKLLTIDPNIDFAWKGGAPKSVPVDHFSVRWTGQVMPRYSEQYTFYVLTDDGVRLWIDGQLLIDQWHDQPATEYSATIDLETGRWYAIQLEYYERAGEATIKLSWSSRSQVKEAIPQSRLYSVRDERAQIEPSEDEGSPALLVGQTVVGQSGPLAKSDFGMPLFSEDAHLFTVSLPAALLPTAAQRELLRRVIEAEKPAYTDYHLCFVEASMRVGFQARVGIDSIVAGPPEPMAMSGSIFGQESYLGADDDGRAGRVGKQARVGQQTRLA